MNRKRRKVSTGLAVHSSFGHASLSLIHPSSFILSLGKSDGVEDHIELREHFAERVGIEDRGSIIGGQGLVEFQPALAAGVVIGVRHLEDLGSPVDAQRDDVQAGVTVGKARLAQSPRTRCAGWQFSGRRRCHESRKRP